MSKKAPDLITNSIKRIKILSKTEKNGPYLKAIHKFDYNTGKTIQRKAEFRSNILRVLSVILPEVEVETLAWGNFYTRHDGTTDFYTRGIDYICEKANMHIRTVSRVFAHLEKIGYMTSERSEAIGKDGKVIRIYSLRKLTRKFYRSLGFKASTIQESIDYKRKKNQIKYYSKKMTEKCVKGLNLIQNLFKEYSKKNYKHKFSKMPNASKQKISVYDTKAMVSRSLEIAEKTGKSPSEIYAELKRHALA